MSVDLGALVASPHFRWMPGMADVDGYRVTTEDLRMWVNVDDPAAPDLDDPATLGCLLAQAQTRWSEHWTQRPSERDPVLVIERVSGGWRWRLVAVGPDGDGQDSVGLCDLGLLVPTYSDAVCAALLAAPPKETS